MSASTAKDGSYTGDAETTRFGTTQVKGFAVSLVLGLLANIFTAVYVSRVIFDWELSGKKVEKLSI